MFTNLKRVLSFAFVDFYRNKGISIAAIFVLIVTTLLVTSLFFMRGISNFLILTIQNKIDITAYFTADTSEQDILNVKNEIFKNSPDVKNIQYVSKEDALNDFIQNNKDNNVIVKALTEVGDNPFLPSLNITTTGNPAQYEQISNILQSDQFGSLIEKVDFSKKEDTIKKVFSITSNVNKFGLGIGIALVLVVILVVFNTIKLVIDSSKEEINTMRIVGASGWFVKAPFIIEGAIFGFISFIFCFSATILSVYFLSSPLLSVMPGFSLFEYFMSNLWIIILIQLSSGVGLGVIASFIVVRKYLKV